MANKPNINTIDAVCKMDVITKQKQIECSCLATNSKNVLSVTASPVLEKCEKEGKFIKLEGVVYTKILYEDNENANCVIDNKCSFAEIIDAGDNAGEFSCICDVNLCDLEFSLVGSDEIKINATLNFEICVFRENQAKIVESDGEDIFVLPKQVKITTNLCNKKEEFAQGYEVNLGKNVARVLDCYSTISQKDATVENGKVILNCSINNIVVYEMADENLTICNAVSSFDFNHSIDVEGCNTGCKAMSKVNLLSDKLQVICEEVDGEMLAQINYSILAQCIVLNETSVDSIVDAYSTSNEITITKYEQGNVEIAGQVSTNEKIDTNLVLDNENKTIEKIYSYSCNSIDLTKVINEGNYVLVEGVAYCNIIYENFDRETQLKGNASIVAEMPFSTKIQMTDVSKNDILVAKAYPMGVDVRIKRSQELDVLAEVKLQVTAVRNSSVNLVEDIEIGEPKMVNDCALSIYLVESGKTYWDVAKQLSINIEELQNQNVDVQLPSENLERIVYYKQLV